MSFTSVTNTRLHKIAVALIMLNTGVQRKLQNLQKSLLGARSKAHHTVTCHFFSLLFFFILLILEA